MHKIYHRDEKILTRTCDPEYQCDQLSAIAKLDWDHQLIHFAVISIYKAGAMHMELHLDWRLAYPFKRERLLSRLLDLGWKMVVD
jgi:hypothetical protein